MLLNLAIFMWYGAVCPWVAFRTNAIIPIYRLIILGVLILVFRRIPVILALHRKIPQIEHLQQAAFVGFFGPIGVSAIFYLYVSLDFLKAVTVDGTPNSPSREDAVHLRDVMTVVIWFLAICSIVVHGLSVPLGKVGYHLPRTMSSALSRGVENESPALDSPQQISRARTQTETRRHRPRDPHERPPGAIFRVGGSAIRSRQSHGIATPDGEPSRPVNFPSGPITAEHSPTGTPANEDCANPIHTKALLVDDGAKARLAGSRKEEASISSQQRGGYPE